MGLSLLIAMAVADPAPVHHPDPYSSARSDFETRLKDAQFGKPGADRALQDWLAKQPNLSGQDRLLGLKQLCGDFAALTWNRIRQNVCAEEVKLKKALGQAEEGDDEQGMGDALANTPPVRAIGSAKVPLIWNRFGSQSANVTVNGVTMPWFMDTGAEISVVTRSLADRIGLRVLAERIRVGTSTSDVFGQVGVIDVLQLGSASVENVPVLVLPDAQLTIGNVHKIDGILGLQVFLAFGRIAWVDGGTMLALGEAAPKANSSAPKLYWHESGLGVPVRTARGIMGAHLDTGANSTDWRSPGVALLDPAMVAKAVERISRVGGAGGVVELKRRELARVEFDLGPVPVTVEKVPIQTDDSVSAGRIGMDAVSQFGTFILDFEQMRIDGRLKTAQERALPTAPPITSDDVKPAPSKEKTDN